MILLRDLRTYNFEKFQSFLILRLTVDTYVFRTVYHVHRSNNWGKLGF